MKVGPLDTQLYQSPHPSGDDPEPALLALINSARSTLFCSIYSLTNPQVAAALVAAAKRGVTVTVVADTDETEQAASLVGTLVTAGIPVRTWGDAWKLCHLKAAVADGKTVALGSYNWTTQAEKSNVECLLIFAGVQVTRGGLAAAITGQITAAYNAGTPLTQPTGGTP